MPKKYVELFLLGTFLAVAVFLYISTATYPQAVQGSTAAYVRFLAVCMGLLCAVEILFCYFRKGRNTQNVQNDEQKSHSDVFYIGTRPLMFWSLLLVLVIYAASFSYLGFYIASALFLPITMFILGARKPISIASSTLFVLLFVYAVFERILEVYMPIGTLFE